MKLISFIVPCKSWCSNSRLASCGEANGYVAVPREHPLFGLGYNTKVFVKDVHKIKYNGNVFSLMINALDEERQANEITLDSLVYVHCGITFAESPLRLDKFWDKHLPEEIKEHKEDYWIFGFDTGHAGDTPATWPIKAVRAETRRFKKELINCISQLDLAKMAKIIKKGKSNVPKTVRSKARGGADGRPRTRK